MGRLHEMLLFSQKTGLNISCELSHGDNSHKMLNPVSQKNEIVFVYVIGTLTC